VPITELPKSASLRIWRGTPVEGGFKDYEVDLDPGMVVLDAVLKVQGEQSGDLAVRWNCKAGKCGSCSAEVNGMPKLMCMTRMSSLPLNRPVTVEPMKSFKLIKDLVTDVSWNYEVDRKIPPFTPGPPEKDGFWRMQQIDVDRGQEFRKCIQCFLCQDVCHVIRNHEEKAHFAGPAFFTKLAFLETHPLDTADRRELIRNTHGVGFCNITKCCTEVCPEHIKITDNAIIPLKERVADEYFDPIGKFFGRLRAEKAERRALKGTKH
jgi:succinate dehydrogenase / fumarate reductase, iron-sulfur subunit